MQTHKQYDSRSLHSSNLYQIFTYVNKDVGNTGNVAGMLLYAKTEETIQQIVISRWTAIRFQ